MPSEYTQRELERVEDFMAFNASVKNLWRIFMGIVGRARLPFHLRQTQHATADTQGMFPHICLENFRCACGDMPF